MVEIPRDFFNYSKILKCLGKISVAVHDGMTSGLTVSHELEGDSFDIDIDVNGGVYVRNYTVTVELPDGSDAVLNLYIQENDKDRWPLMCDCDELGIAYADALDGHTGSPTIFSQIAEILKGDPQVSGLI